MVCGKVPALHEAMEEVLRQAGVCADIAEIRLNQELKERFQLKLYRHLSLMTIGEAHVVVRSIETQKGTKCGFGALALLSQRLNPKTPPASRMSAYFKGH